MSRDGGVLDLRTYELRSGEGERFGRILRDVALPLLARFGINVVASGPSLDDSDVYYLACAFASIAERNERLDAFYGSEEWQREYRAVVLGLIESYHVLLLAAAPPLGVGGDPEQGNLGDRSLASRG